ncbi:beta strand repeat-containing protein [Marinomonas algicola]|uniref:beta strand repeat-containing protein n=1 Tax=Marinomonas algicola TaxID=2773454 RepID=UPI00174B317A|nr:hypothetical protein [Marinomonas algicola]
MAITLTQRTDLITALVGLFDAAPSSELLTGFVAGMDSGATVDSMVNNWGNSAEFASLYPTYLTNEEFAAKFVKALTGSTLDAAGVTLANDFVLAQINGGATQAEAALAAVRILATVDPADATFGAAKQQLTNKVDAATYFATTQNITGATFAQLKSVVAGVDATADSLNAKMLLIDAGLNSVTQDLTTGEDNLVGSAANDIFMAEIFDNQNKAQSGDSIDGKGGNDTLIAEIGNSNQNAITLKTESVENAFFQAQANANDDNANGNEIGDAQIDAEYMNGTTAFWSNSSRADLVIEDIQNKSHLTTIGFRDGDQGDVDYSVYFDNITAPDGTTAGSQLFLEILDLEAAAATGAKLTNNPYAGVQLKIGDQTVEIRGTSPVTTSYADLVAGLNASLVAQGFTTVTATLGEEFNKFNSDNGQKYAGTQIVLTNTGSEALTGIGWIADGVVPKDTNVHTAINDVAPSTTNALTQTNIIFDNVGQSSQGGDFLAGNMSTGNSGSNGIQQFNVTVEDTSWLKTVNTTNNDLERVNVVNSTSTTAAGDLRIGDKAGNAGLVDVQTFDASAMSGKVNLQASLGLGNETLIAKYNDLDDTQSGAANDNVTFSYKTGSADDVLKLDISEEAVAYEDLVLTLETGAGNDLVEFEVKNKTVDLNTNWDEDQAALKNITISTGAGDDTVKALGDGVVTISTGTGNDTVYTDNSGDKATWLFNGTNVEQDILGQGAGAKHFLYNAKLTVTFSSGSADANGGVTVGDAAKTDNGFESTVELNLTDYVADNLDIVQAIKLAIESDDTLNKLLTVEDGPNGSVLVKSLVDGVYQSDDLDVSIVQGTLPATTATDFSSVQDAWEKFKGNSNSANVTSPQLATELAAIEAQGVGFNGTSQLAIGGTVAAITGSQAPQGVAAVQEVQTVTFTDGSITADGNITVGGVTVAVLAADTAAQTATKVQVAIDAQTLTAPASTGNVTATVSGGVVTVTFPATAGDIADIVVAATTATIGGGADTPVIAETTKGVTETLESQTIDVSGQSVASGGTLVFTVDGQNFTYTNSTNGSLSGDALEANIASTLAVTNYTVTNPGGAATGDLTFAQTATNGKDIADITASSTGLLTGSNSKENAADNTINVGTGDDVLILSTNANSNETVVFTGTNLGNVDIFNFEDTTVSGLDILDFKALLTTKQYATGSTSEVSQSRVATTVNTDGIAEANSVTVIDFTAGTGNDSAETFAALTASNLLSALNDTAPTANYGSITEAALDAQATTATQVGDSRDYIVMVHNEANDGQYKVFHLTSSDAAQTGTTVGDFATAELVGTVDLGEDAAFTVANFA